MVEHFTPASHLGAPPVVLQIGLQMPGEVPDNPTQASVFWQSLGSLQAVSAALLPANLHVNPSGVE